MIWKLVSKFIGEFKVIGREGPMNYVLELPEALSRVHNVFHIELLVKYHKTTEDFPSRVVPEKPNLDELGRLEVEEILEMKLKWKKPWYLLKWVGYDRKDATWIKETDLDCPDLLMEFKARNRKIRILASSEFGEAVTTDDVSLKGWGVELGVVGIKPRGDGETCSVSSILNR